MNRLGSRLRRRLGSRLRSRLRNRLGSYISRLLLWCVDALGLAGRRCGSRRLVPLRFLSIQIHEKPSLILVVETSSPPGRHLWRPGDRGGTLRLWRALLGDIQRPDIRHPLVGVGRGLGSGKRRRSCDWRSGSNRGRGSSWARCGSDRCRRYGWAFPLRLLGNGVDVELSLVLIVPA